MAEPRAASAASGSMVAASEVPPAGPAAEPQSYWSGDWASGDWGGARESLQDKGFNATIRLTQGYQGVARGSSVDRGAYGGKFLTDFSFDLEKLAGRKGLSLQLLTETRFGSIPDIIGAKMSTITYLLTPTASGTEFAITALNFTQLVPLDGDGNALALGAGRYMGFDGADSPFNGGGGHTTFMHLAFNGTPTNGRLVPSVTNGANIAWIRNGQPFLTFSVRDAVGHPTTPGLSDLFKDGATFIAGINFPTEYLGKTGKHSLTGMITTRKFTPFFDGPGEVGPVEPPADLKPEAGSWVVQYKMYQYFSQSVTAGGTTLGWGVFGTLAAADGRTNKSGLVLTLGLGGRGTLTGRPLDRWGVAYTQDGVSYPYREQAKPFRISNEKVFEAFYSYALTPFAMLTADLQVIQPMLQGSKTAVLPGVRLVVDF
jgi:porin